MGIGTVISTFLGKGAYHLSQMTPFIDNPTRSKARSLLMSGSAGVAYERFNTALVEDITYPQLHPVGDNKRAHDLIIEVNTQLRNGAQEKAYARFARTALEKIPALIAPDIAGIEVHKTIIALQLASTERFHFYFMTDPSFPAQDILHYTSALHDSSYMITANPDKGIMSEPLGKASEGILCIEHINDLSGTDQKALMLSLTKGSYVSAGGKSKTNVRILAHSNASSGRFVGKSLDIMRRQVPLKPSLLEEFHCISLIRASSYTEKSPINKDDYAFVKGYYRAIESSPVTIPNDLERLIYERTEDLKRDAPLFIHPTSKSMVVGALRLARARARISMRREVREEDIEEAFTLIRAALVVTL